MYKQTVVFFDRGKYTKVSNDVLDRVFSADNLHVSFDGELWICNTPSDGASTCEVIIMQYHFVGLDKVCNSDGAESVQPLMVGLAT